MALWREAVYTASVVNANRREASMEFMMTIDIHRPRIGLSA